MELVSNIGMRKIIMNKCENSNMDSETKKPNTAKPIKAKHNIEKFATELKEDLQDIDLPGLGNIKLFSLIGD